MEEMIADVNVNTLYLGYDKRDDYPVKLGAQAKLTFGELFKFIGLKNQTVEIDNITLGVGSEGVKLDQLDASNGSVPFKIDISKNDLAGDNASADPLVEINAPGKSLSLNYHNTTEEKQMILHANDWNLRFTEYFPVEGLRNLAFRIDDLEYVRNGDSPGKITKFNASMTYFVERLPIFDGAVLTNVTLSLKNGAIANDPNCPFNSTATVKDMPYIEACFNGIEVNGESYTVKSGVRIYLDGDIMGAVEIPFYKEIPVYPLSQSTDEDGNRIYFRGALTDASSRKYMTFSVTFSYIDNKGRVTLSIKDAVLASAKNLFGGAEGEQYLGTLKEATAVFEKGNVKFTTFSAGFYDDKNPIYSKVFGPLTVNLNGVDAAYTIKSDGTYFELFFTGGANLNSFGCNLNPKMDVGFRKKIDSNEKIKIDWKMAGDVDCVWGANMVDFKIRDLRMENEKLKIGLVYLNFKGDQLLDYIKREKIDNQNKVNEAKKSVEDFNKSIATSKDADRKILEIIDTDLGVIIEDISFGDSGAKVGKVTPIFAPTIKFDIVGNEFSSRADFSKLFDKDNPGIYFDKMKIQLNNKMGGKEIPTGFGLFIGKDGVKPQLDKPQKLRIDIPSIELTKDIKIGKALVEVGCEEVPTLKDPLKTYTEWYFRGAASMSLPGALQNVAVDIALVKPHPWENVTGIKHAKLTIKLASSCRIPLGTTPFYIAGFFGALYDGSGMPEGATACSVPSLPPGLKIEAKMFLEFQEPTTLNGNVGFWVQLTALNFGINGELEALKGIVDAQACAALYNNGKNFHGQVGVKAELKVQLRGDFVIDVWQEDGANMSGEANASVGIPRARLLNWKFLKIPRKEFWITLFTQFGKFVNNENGFLTGVKLVGKKFGIGIIGSSFKIGGVDKYKLKKPKGMALLAKRLALAKDIDEPSIITVSGGEVLTVTGAKSKENGSTPWGPDDLKLMYYDSNGNVPVREGFYLPAHQTEESLKDDTAQKDDSLAAYNYLVRSWYNPTRKEGNIESFNGKVRLYLPHVDGTNEIDYDYVLFCSLAEPIVDVKAEVVNDGTGGKKVVFSGGIRNYFHSIKTVSANTDGTVTTVMKQKNRLKLYIREEKPEYAKTKQGQYLGAFVEIPESQFEGYSAASSNPFHNTTVNAIDNDSISLDNLTLKLKNFAPGNYHFGVAVEAVDFMVEDENGQKRELADNQEDQAMVNIPDDGPSPIIQKNTDTVARAIIEKSDIEQPLGAQKFTVTGSTATLNWNGENETRTLFMRWEEQDNPLLAGYKVFWKAHNGSEWFNSTIAKEGHFELSVPDSLKSFSNDCNAVKILYNSTTNKYDTISIGCGEFTNYDSSEEIPVNKPKFQTEIYSPSYDIKIYPITDHYKDVETVLTRTVYNSAKNTIDTEKTTIVEPTRSFEIDESKEISVSNVQIGQRTAVAPQRNRLEMNILDENNQIVPPTAEIIVPINEPKELFVQLNVDEKDISTPHPANYGEFRARINNAESYESGHASNDVNMPSLGVQSSYFTIKNDNLTERLSFTPRTSTKTCKDMALGGCASCSGSDPDFAKKRDSIIYNICGEDSNTVFADRTPFGLYTARIYAINNAYRDLPTADTKGYNIYREVTFKVTPPRPRIYETKEQYLVPNIANQLIHIEASNLWSDLNNSPKVVLMDSTGNVLGQYTDLMITPIDDPKDTIVADSLITLSINAPANNTSLYKLCIVNSYSGIRGTLETPSDTVSIVNLSNFDELGCQEFRPVDERENTNFAMDFIGVYPRKVRPGQMAVALFSQLLDLNPANYTIMLTQDTIIKTVDHFTVADYGIDFTVPNTFSEGKISVEIQLINSISVVGCMGSSYDDAIVISNRPLYQITPKGAGFNITPKVGQPDPTDVIQYSYSDDTTTFRTKREWYYPHLAQPIVPLTHSIWVKAYVRDPEGINCDTIGPIWIPVQNQVFTNTGDSTILGAGDTIRVVKPIIPSPRDPDAPRQYVTVQPGNSRSEIPFDGVYITRPGDVCPITLRTYEIHPIGDRRYDTVLITTRVIACSTYTPVASGHVITIPSTTLRRVLSGKVNGYPLLVHLDSTAFSNWADVQSKGFYFRNMEGEELSFDIEKADYANKRIDVWVKLTSIDADLLNSSIEVVPGTPHHENNPALVWNSFSAVWHRYDSSSRLLTDASGNGHHATLYGSIDTVTGISGNALHYRNLSAGVTHTPGSVNDAGITLSGWIYIDSLPAINSQGAVIAGSAIGDTGTIALIADRYGRAGLTMGNDTLWSATGAIDGGTWIYIAGAYTNHSSTEMADGTSWIMVNGVIVAEGKLNNSLEMILNTSAAFTIGNNGGISSFPGTIDEIRIAPVMLSQTQLRLDYFTQRISKDFYVPIRNAVEVVNGVAPAFKIKQDWKNDSLVYTDRTDFKFLDFPKSVLNQALLQTRYTDRNDRTNNLVQFTVNGPVKLSMLVDERYQGTPAVASGWFPNGEQVRILQKGSTGEIETVMNLYTKQIPSAQMVVISGPKKGLDSGVNILPYTIFIDGLGEKSGSVAVTSRQPVGSLITNDVTAGDFLYPDREYRITGIPSRLAGGTLITPPASDKHSDKTGTYFGVITRDRSIAYLMLDRKYNKQPSFIASQGWVRMADSIITTIDTLNVYSRSFNAGPISLPGPQADSATGNTLQYGIVLQKDSTPDLLSVKTDGYSLGILDSAVQIYSDTSLFVSRLSGRLKGMFYVKGPQKQYANSNDSLFEIALLRGMWIYTAVDIHQKIVPKFLQKFDDQGGWQKISDTLVNNVPSNYFIYSKFLKPGKYSFDGARSGGDTANLFNYIIIADPHTQHGQVEPGDSLRVVTDVQPGDTVFKDRNDSIIWMPDYIKGGTLMSRRFITSSCEPIVLTSESSVQIYYAVSEKVDATRTFLITDGWQETGDRIEITGNNGAYTIWTRGYGAGQVTIPGLLCDGLEGPINDGFIITQTHGKEYRGYHAVNMKVRGFGNERWAVSDNFKMKNLDVSFARAYELQSQSWTMNIDMHSGTPESDTINVLTLATDSSYVIVDSLTNERKTVRMGTAFKLCDLVPTLINTDSIKVNVKTLEAKGKARIFINNKSNVTVPDEFVMVLFEDLDGDLLYNSNVDHFLGRVFVDKIEASVYQEFEIEINDTIAFPNKALFAFVDAYRWVDEINERNNIKSSGTTCEDFVKKEFVQIENAETGRLGGALPELRDTTVYCYLKDNNKDSVIDETDSLYIVYVYHYRLHVVNAVTYDSLFSSIPVEPLTGHNVKVNDFNNDGNPEIMAGSVMYSNNGTLISNFTIVPPSPSLQSSIYDFNLDGTADLIGFNTGDSCLTINSGRDSTLLFVHPFNKWTGQQDQVTVGTLAQIQEGTFNCYDVNASFPRYSVVSGDTVDLTVRVGNAGAFAVNTIMVTMYADTIGSRIIPEDRNMEKLEDGLITIGQKVDNSVIRSGQYSDIKIETRLPIGTKRIWFAVDSNNRYFECNEKDDIVILNISE